MHLQVLEAFRVLDRQASKETIRAACAQLFIESDECLILQRRPIDLRMVQSAADAIYEYIRDPDQSEPHDVHFSDPNCFGGHTIEFCEFASAFSEDMLFQNCFKQFAALGLEELRHALETFLAGLLYHYQFCVNEDRAAFPVSVILEYIEGVTLLLAREQRSEEATAALKTTLEMVSSLDPRKRMPKEASDDSGSKNRRRSPADKPLANARQILLEIDGSPFATLEVSDKRFITLTIGRVPEGGNPSSPHGMCTVCAVMGSEEAVEFVTGSVPLAFGQGIHLRLATANHPRIDE